MEPGTGLTILATAIGSAKLLEKILGPTAEYLGKGIEQFAQKRVENVARIISKTKDKLGDRIDSKGTVPPKVFKGILEEGSFCDDELTAEYFAGVLASSRSQISRDDRGASFIELISRLSSYQIRSHYIFYHIVKDLFNGEDINIINIEGRKKARVFIPYDVFKTAMEFSEDEEFSVLISHILFGLQREDLIVRDFRYGGVKFMRKYFDQATSGGIVITPSALGTELFLWAYSKSNIPIKKFLKSSDVFEIVQSVKVIAGSQKVNR